jgi:hypothetical protein
MNGRKVLATIGISLATALGLCALACLLPDEPYQRWQLAEPIYGGLYTNLRWAYERMHFDDRPVDVAVVGSSRTLIGVSAARVAQQLMARGLSAHVANFSTNGNGRNVQWAVVDELLKTKSPSVIVIGVDGHPAIYGHSGFKLVAPASAIVAPPAPLLHNYIYDLAYLPARQVKLFAARFFPGLVGLRVAFDPAIYANTQTDYSSGVLHLDGKALDMEREVPPGTLLSQTQPDDKESAAGRLELWCCNDGDDRVYIRAISADAKAHGVRLIFVFVPAYGSEEIADRDFLSQYGNVLDNGFLSRDSKLFMNFWHLNHAGAIANSDRIAAAIFELETSGLQSNVQ